MDRIPENVIQQQLRQVAFKHIPASQIFNACDPSFMFDVASPYGKRWWDAEQDGLRELLHNTFVEGFDELTGHYTRLRKSIVARGILNPVVVTLGKPIYRKAWMLPKERAPYLCESCGGSRLMIAQEMGLDVPCIVNSTINDGGEPLADGFAVLDKYHDKTYQVDYGPPTRVIPRRFEHMPDGYRMEQQVRCRRLINQKQRVLVANWKKQNMRKCGT